MKVIAFNGSPRKNGNTQILIRKVFAELEARDIKTELVQVGGKSIKGCRACYKCFKNQDNKCSMDNDLLNECIAKMLEADGIIFGTPVYFYNITAQGKTVIDRTFALGRSKKGLANKVGGIVVVGGSLGLVDALKDLYFYMIVTRMLPAGFVAAYGAAKGDVKDLPKCMQAARGLGKQVVKIAEKKFKYTRILRRRILPSEPIRADPIRSLRVRHVDPILRPPFPKAQPY